MTGHPVDDFGSRRSTVYSTAGMVATAATLNVVEPTSTGLCGDVFALYRTAGSRSRPDSIPSSRTPCRGDDLSVLRPGMFGGAQYVRRDADGVLSGATEPPKDGTVAGR